MGLGYVNGVAEADVRAIVADRDEQGPFASAADLAARCAPRQGTLELLAWAGACDSLCAGGRREALWQLGVAAPGLSVRGGTQLALPVDPHDAPPLRELTPWERMLADYGSTKVTLHEHPLELMRDDARRALRDQRAASRPAAPGGACGWRAWSSRGSGRRPRTASRSCCSRTSSARST